MNLVINHFQLNLGMSGTAVFFRSGAFLDNTKQTQCDLRGTDRGTLSCENATWIPR